MTWVVIHAAMRVAIALHIAVTSRMVPVFAPVALLRMLNAGFFVPITVFTSRQGGGVASEDCGAENKHY